MSKNKFYFILVVAVILIYSSASVFFIRTSHDVVDTTCENAQADYLHLSADDALRFDSTHNAKQVGEWFGWYPAESWGTWSKGGPAYLYVNIDKTEDADVCLLIGGWSVLSENHAHSRVDVFLDGSYVGKFSQTLENPKAVGKVRVPRSAMEASANGNHVLKLLSRDPTTPPSSGENADTSTLGFGISSLQLTRCSA